MSLSVSALCRSTWPLVLVLLASCRTPTKTLVVETDPPGATIWVNGTLQEGTTPVRVPFEWYGRFEVRVERQGYESIATDLEVPTELNGYPIVDLFALPFAGDQVWRRQIRMTPIGSRDVEAEIQSVRRRAEAMRDRTPAALNEPGTPQPEPRSDGR